VVVGAGLLGSHIGRALLSRDVEVVTLSRSSPKGYFGDLLKGATSVVGDAGVSETLVPAIEGADHVVFALSSLMPGEADREPELDMSLILRPLLLLLSQLGGARRVPFTFLSSGGTVYGRSATFPTPEDAPTDPVSSYGITRLAAEKFVLRHGLIEDAPVRILRIGNAYGPGQTSSRGQGFVAAALEHCLRGTPVAVYGDGLVARDYVHVDDVATVVADLLGVPDGPTVLNIGSGTSHSLLEVLDLVRSVTALPLAVEWRARRAFDVERVQLDIGRLRATVPYEPRDLATGIADTWDHLRQGRG
jgi:UDP-glucose 4-epimerase